MSVTTLFVSVAMMMINCERGGSDSPAPGTKAAGTTVTGGVLGGIRFHVDGKHYSTRDYFGTYDPSENRTGFTGGRDGEGGWKLSFSVEGKGTGTFKASAVMQAHERMMATAQKRMPSGDR